MMWNGSFRNAGIIYRKFVYYLSRELENSDISFSEAICLVNIGLEDGISQDDLSKLLSIDKGAITRCVKSLEAKKNIYVEKKPNNKKTKHLHLTEDGKIMQDKLFSIHKIWLDTAFKNMTKVQINNYTIYSDQICKNLDLINAKKS